jgi:hypothetical protein
VLGYRRISFLASIKERCLHQLIINFISGFLAVCLTTKVTICPNCPSEPVSVIVVLSLLNRVVDAIKGFVEVEVAVTEIRG